MALHKNLSFVEVHVPYSFEYADAADRVGATGLTTTDVGKFARQLNQDTIWMLVSVIPVTWKQITMAGHGVSHGGGGSDPSPNATTTVAGLMSALDKVKVDTFAQGNVTYPVRNQSGATIPKGRLVAITGYGTSRALVDLADKDVPARSPAVGMTVTDLLNNSDGDVLIVGQFLGVDTSAFGATDQLSLGNSGNFVLRTEPFTGLAQLIGTVARAHATLGEIAVNVDEGGEQVFGTTSNTATEGNDPRVPTQSENDALFGTDGPASGTNRYVTDSDPRNTNARAPTTHASTHQPGGTDTIPTATASALTLASTASEGAATTLARSDHGHSISAATAPLNVTKAAAAVGTSTDVARADHKHDVTTATAGSILIGDAAAEGASTSVARADHTHALSAPSAPVAVTRSAGAAGTSTAPARADHKHDVTTATAVDVGTANSEGVATSLARSDHVHRGSLLQTVFAEITANTTTTSTTFVTLISLPITIQVGSILIIHVSVGASNTNNANTGFFRVQVDGSSVRAVGVRMATAGEPYSGSLALRITGLSSGSRTVTLQYRTTSNTIQVRPVAVPDAEHASLLLHEVTL